MIDAFSGNVALGRRGVLVAAATLAGSLIVPPATARTAIVPDRRVLWAATVRNKSFRDRIAAAQAGGFTHMSVFPIDYATWVEKGSKPEDMRRALRAGGIKIAAIDPFVQWIPGFAIPAGYPPENVGFINFDEEQVFRIAGELEAEGINCVEGLGKREEQAVLIDAFGSVADRASARGLRVTLEFMPISSIPDLAAGWAVVAGARCPNAGLCFDTWHYYRSTPDDALLATIPGDRIFDVQLADAMNARRGKDLVDDLLRFRMFPGEGELPIMHAVKRLDAIGAMRSVGPEVFADAADALDALEAGRRAGASLRRFVRLSASPVGEALPETGRD